MVERGYIAALAGCATEVYVRHPCAWTDGHADGLITSPLLYEEQNPLGTACMMIVASRSQGEAYNGMRSSVVAMTVMWKLLLSMDVAKLPRG